jgi:hypothetical protein
MGENAVCRILDKSAKSINKDNTWENVLIHQQELNNGLANDINQQYVSIHINLEYGSRRIDQSDLANGFNQSYLAYLETFR